MKVFLTVDTEHSIGGAFRDSRLRPVGNGLRAYGRHRGRTFGIPLIMDIAEGHGLRLTFFIEVLNRHYFGAGESRELCECVLERGHDIQLHAHPNWLNFGLEDPRELRFSDQMAEYPLQRQIEILEEAKAALVSYGAPPPTAFRAGSYAANQDTLRALAGLGFRVDSSYSQAHTGKTCSLPNRGWNDVQAAEGIYEFPITNFETSLWSLNTAKRPMDINGAGAGEMCSALDGASTAGMASATCILHSFSFLKPYDVQYERVRVRSSVVKRFERLCSHLAEHPQRFQVKTFGEVSASECDALAARARHVFPRVPTRSSLWRMVEQAEDRFL